MNNQFVAAEEKNVPNKCEEKTNDRRMTIIICGVIKIDIIYYYSRNVLKFIITVNQNQLESHSRTSLYESVGEVRFHSMALIGFHIKSIHLHCRYMFKIYFECFLLHCSERVYSKNLSGSNWPNVFGHATSRATKRMHRQKKKDNYEIMFHFDRIKNTDGRQCAQNRK
jgi:hypothetical protein